MTRVRKAFIVFFSLSGLFIFLDLRAQESPPPFQVIIHPENEIENVDPKFLADVFLKKTRLWPHEQMIQPVDLHAASSIRRYFTKTILKRSIAEIKNYWQQLIFSGRGVPPPELNTDTEVISFVRSRPGAIGYVSGAANTQDVKVVKIR